VGGNVDAPAPTGTAAVAAAAVAIAEEGGWAAREAADKFFSSVMMKAHSFMKPNASPCVEIKRAK